jgi:hypothetical protein
MAYYIGIRFRDTTNAFFPITFAKDGGKLPSSFKLLHLNFVCNSCLIVWRIDMRGLLFR